MLHHTCNKNKSYMNTHVVVWSRWSMDLLLEYGFYLEILKTDYTLYT